jgi:hypothetical protein
MKVKSIVFSDNRPRLHGIGASCSAVYLGMLCNDGVDKRPQKIASIELDPRSGTAILRKVYVDDGLPARSWSNGSGATQRHVADFCVVQVGGGQALGDDADNLPKQTAAPATTPDPDPPIAKSVQQQPQGQSKGR